MYYRLVKKKNSFELKPGIEVSQEPGAECIMHNVVWDCVEILLNVEYLMLWFLASKSAFYL